MIDISSKLSSFRRLVWDVEKKKSEKQLYDSINTSSDVIDKKKAQLEETMESYLEKRKVFATSRKNEIVARKKEEEKSTFFRYKEELLKETIESIRDELIAYSKTSSYRKNLLKEVSKIYRQLDNNYVLLVKKDDMDLFPDFNTKTMPDSYIGGFIFEATDKSYQYDFTLKRKLEDKKYQIGKSLYLLLEGGDLKNDTNN